jgi:predicted nucleotidyltransferase component of viral defense system
MISPQSRSRDWIYGIREKNPGMDPNLIEKMIMAFLLVEDLHTSGLDFIFKGGTSLALLLGKVQRFSIDIDIVIEYKAKMDPCLEKVIQYGNFVRVEEDFRQSTIPKLHYKLYFYSYLTNQEKSILLDVLLETNPYPILQAVDIQSPILKIEENPTRVVCPSCECLLGDKLTAFAPHTTGIRYNQGKDLEIIKQLFDIASLFDVIEKINVVADTHQIISEREIGYREMTGITPRQVLVDALDTAMMIGLRSDVQHEEYQELASGISKLKGYVYSGSFSMEKGIICSAKLAYLVSLILANKLTITWFIPEHNYTSVSIQNSQYNRLNKLKKTNLEAFHYYHQATINLDL